MGLSRLVVKHSCCSTYSHVRRLMIPMIIAAVRSVRNMAAKMGEADRAAEMPS